MERIPRPGEFYRHFKDRLYQIVAVAVHSETGEEMVVYQALYGDFRVYVRPLDMFMEEVDRQKYPEVLQKYRFEPVIPGAMEGQSGSVESGCDSAEPGTVEQGNEEPLANPLLLAFLDADLWEEKFRVILSMKGKIGQSEIDSLYLVLDVKPYPGSVEQQLDNLIKYMEMQQRFDSARLRRS